MSNLHQSLQCGIWQFLQHTQQAKRFEIFADRSIFCQTDECQAPLSACFINSPLFLVCRECVFLQTQTATQCRLVVRRTPFSSSSSSLLCCTSTVYDGLGKRKQSFNLFGVLANIINMTGKVTRTFY